MKSILAVILVALAWLLLGILFYPKWSKTGSEATISWDVSGYYHYLPGIFIYHDLKKQDWMQGINEKYLPSPALDQSFIHEASGNRVNKYAIGQAVLYSPFFFVAHAYAKLSGSYPADGYSRPYQVAIWLGSLLFAILGLFLLRHILLLYFDERVTAWTILTLGLATNYTEYASITNAMNHSWLFTLMCLLIFFSVRFYKKTDWISAVGIGITLGFAILVRPTEITWTLIPLLWGITSVGERIDFLKLHWRKTLLAFLLCGAIMSIQSMYWKYAGGEWVIYSYRDQGFSWFHPRIWRGLMGVHLGWFLFTPVMLLAMIGWYGFFKKYRSIFWPVFITALLAIYITLCWKHFENAGGLGQRNLIQIYPLMAFPLAISIGWFLKTKLGSWIWVSVFLLNVYYSGWWIYQAHRGGFFKGGEMTTPYFYHVVGRLHPNPDYFKLLDTREYFDGTPSSLQMVFENNFDQDPAATIVDSLSGNKVMVMNANFQNYGISIPLNNSECSWLRLEADFTVRSHEWDRWKMAQWIVQFYDGEKVIKSNLINVQRLIPVDQVSTPIFFDVKFPKVPFTKCVMTLWNGTSPETLWMDNLKVSCFK